MAVTVNGTPTTTAYSSATASYVATMPSGIAVGELLIVVICIDNGSGGTITPPSGWTLQFRTNNGSSAICHAVYYRIADGSETSTYTWTVTSGIGCVQCFRVGGQDATFSDVANSGATGTSTTPTATTVTTATDLALGLVFYHVASGSNVPSLPSGWTDVTNGNGSSRGWRIASKSITPAGAIGSVASSQASSRAWAASLWAIRPAAESTTRAPSTIVAESPAPIETPAPALIVQSPRVYTTRGRWQYIIPEPALILPAQAWPVIVARENRPATRGAPRGIIQPDAILPAQIVAGDIIIVVPRSAGEVATTRAGMPPIVVDVPAQALGGFDAEIVIVPRVYTTRALASSPIVADTPFMPLVGTDDVIVVVPRTPPAIQPSRAGFAPLVADVPALPLVDAPAQIIRVLRGTWRPPAALVSDAWPAQVIASDALLTGRPRTPLRVLPALVASAPLIAPAFSDAVLIDVRRAPAVVPATRAPAIISAWAWQPLVIAPDPLIVVVPRLYVAPAQAFVWPAIVAATPFVLTLPLDSLILFVPRIPPETPTHPTPPMSGLGLRGGVNIGGRGGTSTRPRAGANVGTRRRP